MTSLSLSTMWAQQERFEDLGYFRDYIAAFGYDAIEVSHLTNPPGLMALLTKGVVPLSSLHAPTPNRILENGRRNAELNLASPDPDQSRLALEETKRTIDFAADAGIGYVVVHLGGVGDDRCDEERAVRALYESGQTQGVEWDQARRMLAETRAARAPAHLEVAKASLAELVEYASRRGIAIGIESRLNYHEIPHPSEAAELLAPYSNVEAGFWWDVGHTEVQSRLGMIELASWFPAISDRIIGSHLHDVRGILDHRGPGNGTIDWEMIALHLPSDAVRVMEIDQHEDESLIAGAKAFAAWHGII
jgi:YD repeat-containing protein